MKHSKNHFEMFLKEPRVFLTVLTVLFVLVVGVFYLLPTYVPFEDSVHCQGLYDAARDDCDLSSSGGLEKTVSGNSAEEIADIESYPDCSLYGITGGSEDCPDLSPPTIPPGGGGTRPPYEI